MKDFSIIVDRIPVRKAREYFQDHGGVSNGAKVRRFCKRNHRGGTLNKSSLGIIPLTKH